VASTSSSCDPLLVGFGALMGAVTLMIWFERKAISDMQSRIGPQRWGPFGLLQTLADGIKLFFKEDLIPDQADRFVFKLAPYLAMVPAFITFAIVPVGGDVHIAGHTVELQIANPPMGILLMLAMSGISVYGVMLAGWASGSKYPLLSSVRASGPDDQLRGGPRHHHRHRGPDHRLALSTHNIVTPRRRHLALERDPPGRSCPSSSSGSPSPPNQPPALRRGGGRERAGRRLQHRVLVHPLRPLLHGRVHEHHHHVGHHRDPLLRRARRMGPAGRPPEVGLPDPVVPHQDHHLLLLLRLVPGRPAALSLRPGHGPRLEALIPLSSGWMLVVAGFVIDGWWGS
jgi:hypothetical protein